MIQSLGRGLLAAAMGMIAAAAHVAAQPPTAVPAPSATAPSDTQLLLESCGIDDALLDRFVDGQRAGEEDVAAQVALMTALRQVTELDLDRYARPPAAADLGDAGRGKLWQVRGTLLTIAPLKLEDDEWRLLYGELDELPPDDPRRALYLCTVRLDPLPGAPAGVQNAVFVTMRIPKQLVGRHDLNERVAVQGLLVKNAGGPESPKPVFYARRLAWYPHNYLGDLGMDFALFDDVRPVAHDLKPERECFYQLLATMRKADFAKLLENARANYDAETRDFSVVALFGTAAQPDLPRTMRGKLVTLVGTARRAVAVLVDDADVRERFGIKQYYEVSIYTADSQQNPLIINLDELPAGFPEGENIHAVVRIPAVYLTGFYYSRDATADEQSRGVKPNLQKAPLLIGKTLQHVPPMQVEEGLFTWLFAGSVAAAFLALIVGVLMMMRGERRTRAIIQRQMAPDSAASLNDVQVEYQAKPDFSGIEVAEPPKQDDGATPA